MRASLLIQGQISYFFIGQGGLVRFSYSEGWKTQNPKNSFVLSQMTKKIFLKSFSPRKSYCSFCD
ncbi:hypothetical protein EJN90_09400 [Jeotgalibaca ciconiae]|uniref:Uncharacterized protein n=1 Tax=Jeotgalibaca ciconiae TaxID=2496265 RepID=A0A3S9HBU5_9LACT|nr:hypothetical protein EJN90_09400 [Jeotgalibaca ciconiae]